MTYSFDIFDTCLCRLCGEPNNLFDVLSLKVQDKLGTKCNEQLRQYFVATRTNIRGHSLTEIYQQVAAVFPLPCSTEEMVQMELEVEREMLVPILATQKLVNNLRRKGKIMFISDMYLPKYFLQEQLTHNGFFQEGDILYVSDTVGAWKHDGSLFRLIHDRERIKYSQWHHYGDNRNSDYVVPKKMGINAHHLCYNYLPYEKQWMTYCFSTSYPYPSIASGVSRAIRLRGTENEYQKKYVSNITAPLITAWTTQVLHDAALRKIKRVYFCARDMHTHYLVAKSLNSFFPNVEPKYLYISRESLNEQNRDCSIKYFIQEGLLSHERCAIADSRTSGLTLTIINQLAKEHGLNDVFGYFQGSDTNNISNPLPYCTNSNTTILHQYIGSNRWESYIYGILIEKVQSINCTTRTKSYIEKNGLMVPSFDESKGTWEINDFEEMKKGNDNLSINYARAFFYTGLSRYCHQLLERLFIPTLINFSIFPEKEYLPYLSNIKIYGKPFVGRISPFKNINTWRRASIIYTLPTPLAVFYHYLFTKRRDGSSGFLISLFGRLVKKTV